MGEIEYSDGQLIEGRILELLRQARELGSLHAISKEYYASWPIRYHLCPERANLLRHLDFAGLRVIELGAGMGGVSRYLAERAASLSVIEGTRARFAALSERLRDLSNWSGQVANIQDVVAPPDGVPADVVCLIGVLEYSELHVSPPAGSGHSPFSWVLERASRLLAPDGVLLVAIENRLGLKYWAGAPEDHTGRLFDGIAGYPLKSSPRTFSRGELRALLARVGLSNVREYYPFPDYKIASSVISPELVQADAQLSAELACSRPFESYGVPRVKLLPEALAMSGLAGAGLLPELANSFLFLAAREESTTLSRLAGRPDELGWHYSLRRSVPTRTVFLRGPASGGQILAVRKEPLRDDSQHEPMAPGELSWRALPAAPPARGESLGPWLLRAAYFGDWTAFQSELLGFLRWSLSHWKIEGARGHLRGEAVDAIWVNAKRGASGEFVLFDLEWEWQQPVAASWFVLRNVHVLDRERDYLAGAPFPTLAELYHTLCAELGLEPELDVDLGREARFQAAASSESQTEVLRSLRRLFAATLPGPHFARDLQPASEPGDDGPRLARAVLDRVKSGIKRRPRLDRLARRVKRAWSRS